MKQPHFWSAGLDPKSRAAAPLTRALLTPLEALYLAAYRRKWQRALPHPAPVPVICVGNVTVGGVGKTPIVALLRERLTTAGHRAASLSRGHGGTLRGPVKVDVSRHTAREVGDEPLMLACSGESWIGRDRAGAAEAMAEDGVEVIIMDDGFQNPSLEKTASFLVIDSDAPFGNGHCLPKGPLREPVSMALARADLVLLTGIGPVPPGLERRDHVRIEIVPRAKTPPSGPLIAFAGIGRPTKLFDSLSACGADLREGVGFDDHYVYKASDMNFLRKLASDHSARLITTEKDYVRLPADWRDDILTWPVEAEPGDGAERMDALLKSIVERIGHGR